MIACAHVLCLSASGTANQKMLFSKCFFFVLVQQNAVVMLLSCTLLHCREAVSLQLQRTTVVKLQLIDKYKAAHSSMLLPQLPYPYFEKFLVVTMHYS
jgi:hypothetical protein